MKVLSVNKFHYMKGGSEACYFALNKMCEENGAEVVNFSMKHPQNEPNPYENWFVENIDYGDEAGALRRERASLKAVWSAEARCRIARLADISKPDIAHLHIFQHQLSPSIIKPLKKRGIPVVNTVHDLKPLCPAYTMFTRGRICERCRPHRYISCLATRCFKGSAAASAVATAEMYLHHALGSYRKIDMFITPSRFFRDKFIEYGFAPEKVRHIPNFVNCSRFSTEEDTGNYILYFGRLSAEKGLMTLLEAMKLLPPGRGVTLYIAGDGPLRPEMEEYISRNSLRNVRLLGHVAGRGLVSLLEMCRFTVLPSEWYENCPMSVLESMACGKAVVGSAIGGIPELVEDGVTGLTFRPGDADGLAACIGRLLDDPAEAATMGAEGRRIAEERYSPGRYFGEIKNVYNELLERYGRPLWKD